MAQKLTSQQLIEFVASVLAEENHRETVAWAELDEHQLSIPGGQRLCKRVWVSDDGQVAFQGEYDEPQLVKQQERHSGYLAVKIPAFDPITNETHYHNRDVHRLVLIAFTGLPPSKYYVARHLDGVRKHNDISNLCWGTRYENAADRIRHGTWANTSKRMTTEQRQMVLADIANPHLTYREVAEKHNLSRRHVRYLRQQFNLPRKPIRRSA